jgi:SulP family sulfate permease
VITGYAETLAAAGGRLYLSGVDQHMIDRFHRSQVRDVQGKIKIFHADPVLGASTLAALQDAKSWLVGQSADNSADNDADESAPNRKPPTAEPDRGTTR